MCIHSITWLSTLVSRLVVSIVHAMQNHAINTRPSPFISMQNHHSSLYREDEQEMPPTLKAPNRSLAKQTRRGASDKSAPQYIKRLGTVEVVSRLEEIAKKKEISIAQVAVSWSLAKMQIGVSAQIVGTTSLNNLEDIIGGALQIERRFDWVS
ncbi:hypothetical protein JAAARDRAFT_536168 [Jaapia argillacea MUCL 33604]|uniref:NADP-dependent oxidoreductase domain-containing protein n=1 Tax=Jaapia argillacea MUCL 33604 TaxID=933084 RepID=A0A067PLC9_9AGAM|nr:hypothetical protein JAAARDRAFT_536168 [Jaapia argillacea MUCL 33604]